MSQVKDYQVNYSINVTATEGVQEVERFARAMKQLSEARGSFLPAVKGVNEMMQEIERTFRPKGKKRDYSFKLNIETNKSEEKLSRVKNLIQEIKEISGKINLVVNAGEKLDSNTIRSQAKALVNKKELEGQQKAIRKTASESLKTISEKQKDVTHAIGKINSALASLDKGHEINIRTDVAKNRLTEILGLLRQIKTASNINMPLQMGNGKITPPAITPASVFRTGSILTDKVWERQQKQYGKASEARKRMLSDIRMSGWSVGQRDTNITNGQRLNVSCARSGNRNDRASVMPPKQPGSNGNRNGSSVVTPQKLPVTYENKLLPVKRHTEANAVRPLTVCNIPNDLPYVTCHW